MEEGMKRYVLAILIALVVLGGSQAQAVIIDDFMATNGELCQFNFQVAHCAGVLSSDFNDSNVDTGLSGVLGGTRDLIIQATTAGTGAAYVAVGAGIADFLDYSNPPNFRTTVTIVWDGDSTTNNPNADPALAGIGASLGAPGVGIDLTEGGTHNAIEINIQALDLPLALQVIVVDALGNKAIDSFMKRPCNPPNPSDP
jgi:hypothetical protein